MTQWVYGEGKALAGVNLIDKPLEIDFSMEGRRWQAADRKQFIEDRYQELLAIEPPNPKYKRVTVDQKTALKKRATEMWEAFAKAKGIETVGVNGTFRPPQDSPVWMSIPRLFNLGSKQDLVMGRGWAVLTGQQRGKQTKPGHGRVEYFKELEAFLVTIPPDKRAEFVDALYPFKSITDAARIDSWTIPEVLLPLKKLSSSVDGEGELLCTFIYPDMLWCPGTGRHDLSPIIGREVLSGYWHVKDGLEIRMGCSAYTTSKIRDEIVELAKRKEWVVPNDPRTGKRLKTDVRHSLGKLLIEANVDLLAKHFNCDGETGLEGFTRRLDEDMQKAEADTRGVVFFNGNQMIVREMKDVICVGATKGDFECRPGPVTP